MSSARSLSVDGERKTDTESCVGNGEEQARKTAFGEVAQEGSEDRLLYKEICKYRLN